MSAPGRSLIISDGGLAGVLAAAIEAQHDAQRHPRAAVPVDDRSIVWAGAGALLHHPSRDQATARQAEVYGLEFVPHLPPESPTPVDPGLGFRYEAQTGMLLRAGYLAIARGCDRVIWTATAASDEHGHPELTELTRIVERASLVSSLASLDLAEPDEGRGVVTIETPFADLNDDQLADLAVDLGAPVELCWWSGLLGDAPGAGHERARWRDLLGIEIEPKPDTAPDPAQSRTPPSPSANGRRTLDTRA